MSASRARSLVAAAAAPVVDQMVVFKDGSAKIDSVRASATHVNVGRRRCAVGAGTPLAALARGKVATLRLTDYGSCGPRARDAGGLYVRGIGSDYAGIVGDDGWVYKVGNKAAPAGAADPSGPFGRGLLRSGQRVTWFWCDAQPGVEGCQQTLELKVTSTAEHAASVRVRGYDNAGRGTDIAGVAVSENETVLGASDASGAAAFTLTPGPHTLVARKDGLVRSYPVEVNVR